MKLKFPLKRSQPWAYIVTCNHETQWEPSKRFKKFYESGGWLPLDVRERPFHFKNINWERGVAKPNEINKEKLKKFLGKKYKG